MINEENKKSLKGGGSKLQMTNRTFKPPAAKKGLAQSTMDRPTGGLATSTSVAPGGYGRNTNYDATNASSAATSGGPPIGNPNNFTTPPTQSTTGNGSLKKPATSKLGTSLNPSSRSFNMSKTARAFVPKNIPAPSTQAATQNGSAEPAKQESKGSLMKASLKVGAKTFVPKNVSQTVDPTSRPATQTQAIKNEKEERPNQQKESNETNVEEEEKETAKVSQTNEAEASLEENKTVAKEESEPKIDLTPTQSTEGQVADKDKDAVKSVLDTFREHGKLSLEAFLSLKDLPICSWKEEEKPIFINSDIFSRQVTPKPYQQVKGKGKGGYHKTGFQKGGGYHNYDNHNRHQNQNHNNKNRHSHHNKPPRENYIKRNKISQEVIEMRGKADKWKGVLKNTDKFEIEKQAKALLNKITPDNMKKLRDQITEVLVNCESSEDRKKFIKIFFKKATHEDKYCSMYTDLIKYIGEKEYDIKADETPTSATPTSKSKVKKAKESQFKKDLVDECKSTLLEFESEMNAEDVPEEDKVEFEYRYKKRLFGNLKFIAELYKKRLVGPQVALYVMAQLLGLKNVSTKTYNDFTIEGACTFISKVGEKLDKSKKIKELDEEKKNEAPESPMKKGKENTESKSKKNQDAFEEWLSKLKYFETDESVDSRVRILIKNTLAKRENNWKENIQDEGPKTKKQIKKDLMRELQGIDEEEPKPAKKLSNKKKSAKQGMFAELSMEKIYSTTSIVSEYNEESDKEPEPVKKEYSPRELEHRDHEAIKDRYIGNFTEWINNGKIELTMFEKPENKCTGDKIVCMLLEKLYDKQEEEVVQFNQYFFELFQKHLFNKSDIEKGVTQFFEIIPNIESDFPHLAKLFGSFLYFVFEDKNIADFSKVEIKLMSEEEEQDDEEPMYFIDIYFKILAALLSNIPEDKRMTFYSHHKIEDTAKLLRPHVLEEDLFLGIKEELGVSDQIVKLLDIE